MLHKSLKQFLKNTIFSGNVYINTSVGGLIEIPCYIVCMLTLHLFGRRIPLTVMFLSSAIILLISTGNGASLYTGCSDSVFDFWICYKWHLIIRYVWMHHTNIMKKTHHLIWKGSWYLLTYFLFSKLIRSKQAGFHC